MTSSGTDVKTARELVVAIDVGATNVRARIAVEGVAVTDDLAARVGSAQDGYGFVADVVGVARDHGEVAAALVAVAGMVRGDRVHVTNWPTDSLIEIGRLEDAGLPIGRTQLVNDMVAGVWGALARVDVGAGNLVYIAPGTGLGAAALVRHGLGPLGGTVVACEAQHTQLPRFEGEIARTLDELTRVDGRAPTWEDLVSGPGLVRVYQAQRAMAGSGSGPSLDPAPGGDHAGLPEATLDAAKIAEAARRGDDPNALAAIRIYYLALGHFAQALAMTCLPCAAVVIGGASTRRNLELLHASGLAETFATHPRFGDMLAGIPIHTLDGDANLEGGVWLAAHAGR